MVLLNEVPGISNIGKSLNTSTFCFPLEKGDDLGVMTQHC